MSTYLINLTCSLSKIKSIETIVDKPILNYHIKIHHRIKGLWKQVILNLPPGIANQMVHYLGNCECYYRQILVTNDENDGNDGNDGKKKMSGFTKPFKVSNDLCDFMDIERGSLCSRSVVLKRICEYINEHNLRKPTDNKIILPDKKLQKILDPLDKNINNYTYINLMGYISHNFKYNLKVYLCDVNFDAQKNHMIDEFGSLKL